MTILYCSIALMLIFDEYAVGCLVCLSVECCLEDYMFGMA